MTRFTASTESVAVVSARRSQVWRLLTDPGKVAEMTPLLERIHADGDLWRWQMTRIPVLGVSVAPSFTERMTFDPERRIDFTHAPPGGEPERGAVEGYYRLEDVEQGTRLAIRLQLCVDLPLPRATKRAVSAVMGRVMEQMGARFAVNLLRELDAARVD
jgi:carbon monoxide dehydrogenase subunit G